jgi:predicted GTPase
LRAGCAPAARRIFLAVNKVDNAGRARNEAEFTELGFDGTFSIAAVHGTGVSELLDAATEEFAGCRSGNSATDAHRHCGTAERGQVVVDQRDPERRANDRQ